MIPLALALAVFLACDVRWRRIPGEVALIVLAAGVVFGASPTSPKFWLGFLVGGGLTLLAGFPGGDSKAAAVLGALAGPFAIALILTGAFVLTLLAWRLRVYKAPWMVYVGVAHAWWILATVSLNG